MIRISHVELAAAQQDFAAWWRTKQAPATGGRRLGYAQAVKLAIYKYHSLQANGPASLAHFDQLVSARLTNAQRIAQARLQLQAYIDWVEGSGVIVADHRVRLNMITVDDDLAFESARKFEPVKKHVSWVAISWIPVPFANVLVAVPRVVIARVSCPSAPEFDPMDLEVTRVFITVSRIIPARVRHRGLPPVARVPASTGETDLARARWAREAGVAT